MILKRAKKKAASIGFESGADGTASKLVSSKGKIALGNESFTLKN